jgi:hypothetical protein
MELIVDEPASSVEEVLFQIAATDLVVASSNGGGGVGGVLPGCRIDRCENNDSPIHDT